MVRLVRIAVLAVALAVAGPANAQFTFSNPGQQPGGQQFQPVTPVPVWENVARVNLGVGFYNAAWYSCYYSWNWGWTSCSSSSYTSYIPFLVGPQVDLNLGGMNNLSVGFTVAIGTVSSTWWNGSQTLSNTANVTMWEPTVDYVAKFGPSTQDTVGRFRIGAGMYIGPDSHVGGAFRIGGGASFLNTSRVGAGIDVILEGGSFNGYWIGGLQLQVSPEFHF
jgi:hypothetical protein